MEDDVMPETGMAVGHIYTIDATDVERRMKVVWNQLIVDMINDTDMDQVKKMVALKFIDKTRQKLLFYASKQEIDYDVIIEFKKKMAEGKLKLLFKEVKSSQIPIKMMNISAADVKKYLDSIYVKRNE